MCVARKGVLLIVGIPGNSPGCNCQDQHVGFFFFLQFSESANYTYVEMETKYNIKSNIFAINMQYMCAKNQATFLNIKHNIYQNKIFLDYFNPVTQMSLLPFSRADKKN